MSMIWVRRIRWFLYFAVNICWSLVLFLKPHSLAAHTVKILCVPFVLAQGVFLYLEQRRKKSEVLQVGVSDVR